MTTQELHDHIHIYSMFSFRDGRKEAGICINKYNIMLGEIEFYFIAQEDMHAYKIAFDKYDKETCNRICQKLQAKDLINIRPVSLSDYKIIMQLLYERNLLMTHQQ